MLKLARAVPERAGARRSAQGVPLLEKVGKAVLAGVKDAKGLVRFVGETLLAGVALLLGLFAVLVTPREEEPQINVTMANVLIPFPGASVADVEQMVATPAEQVLVK